MIGRLMEGSGFTLLAPLSTLSEFGFFAVLVGPVFNQTNAAICAEATGSTIISGTFGNVVVNAGRISADFAGIALGHGVLWSGVMWQVTPVPE